MIFFLRITLKFLFWITISIVLFLVVVFVSVVCENYMKKPIYYKAQVQRVEELGSIYADVNYERVDENLFADFDTNDLELMKSCNLHSFRALATHNSYKQGLNPCASFLFNYCIPFMGNYNYSFENITSQLNNGVRSFEIDVTVIDNNKGRVYEIIHHPLLDNKTSAIDFRLCLREIAMWSENNPTHMPITVLFEVKPRNVIASTKDATVDDIKAWSGIITEEFKGSYYSSKDMLKDKCNDYYIFTKNDKYPSLEEMKGKVMFLLHDGDLVREYISQVEVGDMEIFPLISGDAMAEDSELRKFTPFSISNYPLRTELISKLTDEYNLIVRTRLDDYPVITNEDFDAALSGNAQILTTDWPPITQRGVYVAYLKGSKTMILER